MFNSVERNGAIVMPPQLLLLCPTETGETMAKAIVENRRMVLIVNGGLKDLTNGDLQGTTTGDRSIYSNRSDHFYGWDLPVKQKPAERPQEPRAGRDGPESVEPDDRPS